MWTMTDRFRFDCTRADYIFMRLRRLHRAQALRKRASDRKVRFGTGRCPFPWRERLACLTQVGIPRRDCPCIRLIRMRAARPWKQTFEFKAFSRANEIRIGERNPETSIFQWWLYRNSCAISSDEKFFFPRRNIGEKKLGECFKGKKVSRVKSAYIKRDETFYGNLRFLLENDLSLSLSLR